MSSTEQDYFRRAFELAYFIHPNVDIALRVAEVAVCKLDATFGKQGKRFYYVPAGRTQSHGFSFRSLRTKISLRQEHLLQLLVYAESDSLERGSEYGSSSYAPTEEDMVIRFIKHLVRITIHRNSFYVVLGVGRLLYEYETSQVRQMYDVLMQDQSRFKDNSYLRKQKNVLMRELLDRFDKMLRTEKTPQREVRFVRQPTTKGLIRLVEECLVRFTPWDTTCVLIEKVDPIARIPAFAFSGQDSNDESPVEMNRIHTIIDPDCFSRLVANLGFAPTDKRLAVPYFFFSDRTPSQGDRFNPPPLSEESESRLRRARKDNARRRKLYRVGQLRILIDDKECMPFDPRRTASIKFQVPARATIIEVQGKDEEGDLTLATLLVPNMLKGRELRDSVTLEDGQELKIRLAPITDDLGKTKETQVELKYRETRPVRVASWVMQRAWFNLVKLARIESFDSEALERNYAWLIKVGIVAAFIVVASIIVWYLNRTIGPTPSVPSQVELLPTPTPGLSLAPTETPARTPSRKIPTDQIAQAAWTMDPHTIDRAIRLELRRGEAPIVEISKSPNALLVAVNSTNLESHQYRRYRIKLTAGEEVVWQLILGAPTVVLEGRVHVLRVEILPERFPKADVYRLQVEGESENGWQLVGQLGLKPVNH